MSKIKNLLLYSGVEKEQYEQCRPEMDEHNYRILKACMLTGIVIFLALTVVTGFTEIVRGESYVLGIITIICCILFWINEKCAKKNRLVLYACLYGFMFQMYIAGIYAGTIANTEVNATTFIVFLVGFPLVFILQPIHHIIYTVVIDVMFVLASFWSKSQIAAYRDLVNAILYGSIAIILIFVMNKLTIKGFVAINEQQRERDLAASNAVKTQFFAQVSHDMRTPLNGILGLIEMNERYPDREEMVRENRAKAKIAAKHLLELVEDVLNLSRLEAGGIVLEHVPFNVREVAKESSTILVEQAEIKGLSIIVEPCEYGTTGVIGSPLHLKKVLMNLFTNAMKYNKPQGKIYLRTRCISESEDQVVYEFRIKDTGVGMSEEFIKNDLFMPFNQEGDSEKSKRNGVGLGLSIVKEIVDAMQGTIEVESVQGEGSAFTVTLPFEINRESVQEEVEVPSVDLKGMRILLVDDVELNLEIAKFLLEEEGAICSLAENGKIAVDLFEASEEKEYDLILMDVMMPVMNGYEATKAIRALDRQDAVDVPIIAMTANAFSEDIEKCKEEGMDEHLPKPVDMVQLKSTVAKCLYKKAKNKTF